jgi:hypothetical protein
MKLVLTMILTLLLVGTFSMAQAEESPAPAQPAQDMQMMNHQGMMDCPMMKSGDGKMMMNCPKMKGSMGMMSGMKGGMMQHHQMMMNDMMLMMKNMMAIQKQLLGTPSSDAKIKMDQDLSAMITKMDAMMSSSNSMTMNMQKPAADGQQKEQPAPMEHKH